MDLRQSNSDGMIVSFAWNGGANSFTLSCARGDWLHMSTVLNYIPVIYICIYIKEMSNKNLEGLILLRSDEMSAPKKIK